MLDENLVFHKTGLGAREVAAAAQGLSAKLRRALILVDGAKTLAEIAPLFRPGEIDAIVVELQARGLVTLADGMLAPVVRGTADGATEAAAGAIPEKHFEEVRRRAMREISDRLGPNGDTLALRIERCRTPEELRVALREAEKILVSFLGAEYGRAFARKIGRDLALGGYLRGCCGKVFMRPDIVVEVVLDARAARDRPDHLVAQRVLAVVGDDAAQDEAAVLRLDGDVDPGGGRIRLERRARPGAQREVGQVLRATRASPGTTRSSPARRRCRRTWGSASRSVLSVRS